MKNWFQLQYFFVKKKLSKIKHRNAFRKISYSQAGEDLIVKYIFDSIGLSNPYYVDIGAHHPEIINNTKIFYDTGSSGINIEANPNLISAFNRQRKRDINLNLGISDKSGTLDFHIFNDSTLSTFSTDEATILSDQGFTVQNIIPVKIISVKELFETYAKENCLDFLSLDAEGVDFNILTQFITLGLKPVVICVESISFSTSGAGKKNQQIINLLKSAGYIHYADTNINSIFVLSSRWIRR
jgi:FkbM family methyltransferase